MALLDIITERASPMQAWRHELHAHPELGFEEVWTSDFIAEKLESFGIEVHRGIAKTGVVGVIRGHHTGNRAIGLRADIDALPITEMNNFAHRSQHDGKMHACGHDGHTAMLLGAAQYLAETRNFSGDVVVIFQPAEEGGAGGKVMVEEGLFRNFAVETVWGLHNWPGLSFGKAIVHHDVSMAASDIFNIVLKGKAGHAAMPQTSIDAIPAGASLVQSLQTIVSRKTSPLEAAVISVTEFHSGTTHNIIADRAEISGTARYLNREMGDFIEAQMRHIAESVGKMHACEVEFVWEYGYPPTINHSEQSEQAADVLRDLLGQNSVIVDAPPSMGSEDFSYMLEERAGSYIWLGAGEEEAGLHNSSYDFNDKLLPLGASYWVQLVESQLPRISE